jgi:bacillithiol system protein YtxJ
MPVQITDVRNVDDLRAFFAPPPADGPEADAEKLPVLLFKHSTRCGTSSFAWRQVQEFAQADPAVEIHRILVVENRDVAQAMTETSGIKHESPQAMLLRGGKVVWHTSHGKITKYNLDDALASV